MDIKDLVLTDEALSVIDNGAWVRDLPNCDGLSLKVLGFTSAAAVKAINATHAAKRIENGGKPLDNEQLAACTTEVLGSVILVDWDGLNQDGKPIEFDRELAKKWITSRNGEKLASLVLQAAQRVDSQAQELAEALEKN